MHSQFHQEIEALTGASTHLDYARSTIQRIALDSATKQSLNEQLAAIRKRYDDDHLYLSVVGEASTGKSTLINALLQDKLLEAKALTMTTAAATAITAGATLTAKVRFHAQPDNRNFLQRWLQPKSSSERIKRATQVSELEFLPANVKVSTTQVINVTTEDEPITIHELPGVQKLSLRQLIGAFTAADEIARRIVGVTLTHPATFLQEGICLIDTPGADATNDAHAEITRNVVAASDASIIITPAKQIVSDALIKLITQQLRLLPYLHRSIFLITGMDWIRERERERLVQAVINRLKTGLQIEQLPPVLFASAQSVVDEFSGEPPEVENEADRRQWQAQFDTLKTTLFAHLKRQRSLTIAESVLRLLDELFEALNHHLDLIWQHYREKRDALQAAVIPDLEAFAQEQYYECHDTLRSAVDNAEAWIEMAVDQCCDQVLDEVHALIARVTSLNELKTAIEKGIQPIFARHQRELQGEITPRLNEILDAAKAAHRLFDQRFKDAYQRLNLINKNMALNASSTQIQLSSSNLVSAANSTGMLVGPNLGQQMTGAAVGAVLVNFVLPGVGLLIGAALGSWLSGLLGPTLQERKNEIWREIRSQISQQFVSVKRQYLDTAYSQEQRLRTSLDSHIDDHVQRYHSIVLAMQEEQEQEENRLAQLQNQLIDDMEQLKQRHTTIQSQMETLRSITAQI